MLKLLKNRNFALYWAGQTISGIGTWIDFVGLNLYVLHLTGSGGVLGSFLVVRMLPSLFFGSLGGYLADRFPRRTILICCDLFRAVLVLGFVFTTDIRVFYVIGFFMSAVDKIFMSTHSAFLPNIVTKEELLEANSLTKMTTSVIMVLGPALGAILVNLMSYKAVFVVDSATFMLSVVSIFFIKYNGIISLQKRKNGIIEEFKETFRFFRHNSAIMFLAVIRLIDALGSGSYNTALPIFSKDFPMKKGAAYGWLVGVWALGQFLGSYLVNFIPQKEKLSREKIFSMGVILMAIGMGLTFRTGNFYFSLAAIFVGGLGDGISNVLYNLALMKETPDEIRGKVFGSTIALTYTVVAIGMAGAGFLSDIYPLHNITDACSILIFVSAVIGYLWYKKKAASEPRSALIADERRQIEK